LGTMGFLIAPRLPLTPLTPHCTPDGKRIQSLGRLFPFIF